MLGRLRVPFSAPLSPKYPQTEETLGKRRSPGVYKILSQRLEVKVLITNNLLAFQGQLPAPHALVISCLLSWEGKVRCHILALWKLPGT